MQILYWTLHKVGNCLGVSMGTLLKWPVEAGNNSLKELFSIPQAGNCICHSEPRTIQPNAIMAKCSLSMFGHESIGLKSGFTEISLNMRPQLNSTEFVNTCSTQVYKDHLYLHQYMRPGLE